MNAYNRATAERNKDRYAEWRRAASRRQWAKRYLGLTDEDYETYLARADGLCEVCGRPEASVSRNGNRHKLALDHDHATMQFRGMLCRACNTALGCANDDPALLRKLADYLDAGGIR